MLRIKINKQLGLFALDVELESAAKVLGLFGPSGAGKTTLLNCIAGITKPDSGSLAVNGKTVFDHATGTDLAIRHRRIGYVFQDALLFEHMSVDRNLRYGSRSSGARKFSRVVDVLEIGDLLDRSAAKISGGEKRRVALGRALLSDPALLLLDEPLAGLDRRLAGKTICYIKSVLEEFEIPAIYVSHSVGDILYLCDDVATLDRGALTAQGEPFDLVGAMENIEFDQRPAIKNIVTLPVHDLDTANNLVRCELNGKILTVAARVDSGVSRVTVMIPARDIILAVDQPGLMSARNVIAGRITRIQIAGSRSIVFVDVGCALLVEVTHQAAAELKLAAGAAVFVVVKASSIHCVDAR